jgi:hypothetical protein
MVACGHFQRSPRKADCPGSVGHVRDRELHVGRTKKVPPQLSLQGQEQRADRCIAAPAGEQYCRQPRSETHVVRESTAHKCPLAVRHSLRYVNGQLSHEKTCDSAFTLPGRFTSIGSNSSRRRCTRPSQLLPGEHEPYLPQDDRLLAPPHERDYGRPSASVRRCTRTLCDEELAQAYKQGVRQCA